MEIVTPAPNRQIAHPLQIRTTIVAGRDFEEVAVSYHLLNKADVDAKRENVRQFNIGTENYELVHGGSHRYEASITIPDKVDPPGDYYVVASVDPADQITEANEGDNFPSWDNFDGVPITVLGDKRMMPDLVMRKAVPDDETVVLEKEGTSADGPGEEVEEELEDNTAFGVTIEMATSGSGTIHSVPIQAFVQTETEGEKPLRIWDSEKKEWVDTLELSVDPAAPSSVHLSLNIPDSNGSGDPSLSTYDAVQGDIKNHDKKRFDVTICADKDDRIPEHEEATQPENRATGDDDNKITTEVVILPPAPAPPPVEAVVDEREWRKGWKNRILGAEAVLQSRLSFDHSGVIGKGTAGVDVTLLGKTFSFLEFDAHGQHTPNETSRSCFGVDLKFVTKTLFSRSKEFGHVAEYNPVFVKTAPQGELTVPIGPIPVKIRGTIMGKLGCDLKASITDSFVLTAKPHVDINGEVEGGVTILVASVTLAAKFIVVKDTFTTTASAGIKYDSANEVYKGDYSFKVENDVVGPSLHLVGRVKFPAPFFIGIRDTTKELSLVKWESFARQDVLFERAKTLFSVKAKPQ